MTRKLLWLDTEFTTSSPDGPAITGETLLSVAARITNSRGEKPSGLFEAFAHVNVEIAYERSIPLVQTMHENSGLWTRLRKAPVYSYENIDRMLASFIAENTASSQTILLAGNNLIHDRVFLHTHLPLTNQRLSHRNVDVSSIEFMMVRKYGEENLPTWEQIGTKHDAASDIDTAIHRYRQLLNFKE